jgi:hypothetical protein
MVLILLMWNNCIKQSNDNDDDSSCFLYYSHLSARKGVVSRILDTGLILNEFSHNIITNYDDQRLLYSIRYTLSSNGIHNRLFNDNTSCCCGGYEYYPSKGTSNTRCTTTGCQISQRVQGTSGCCIQKKFKTRRPLMLQNTIPLHF